MNKNTLTGVWQKTKGKIKEEVGHLTGNKKMESQGVGEQIRGGINKDIGSAKDALKKTVDSVLKTD